MLSKLSFVDVRPALWHLRRGGICQLKEHLRRNKASNVLRPFTLSSLLSVKDWPEWPIPDDRSLRRSLKVGVIADQFTELAFQFEWDQRQLTPQNWRDELAGGLDLVFVESAWNGSDGAWKYQLTGKNAPSEELVALVDLAKSVKVPCVFWNKEDPAHYEDFVETASLFDWVYTTEVSLISKYREQLGHNQVGLLPFAAQQAIHNPMWPAGWKVEDLKGVSFAGTYFRHKYPERRKQMGYLLKGAAKAAGKLGAELDIFSRFCAVNPNYVFPEEFADSVVGELTYRQMLTAYRAYRTFLNVNSVPNSESMCGRRIFEVLACGTPVVSSPTSAIDNAFPNVTIPQVNTEEDTYDWIRSLLRSPELRDRLTHLAQRQIWLEHTYSHRVNQILSDVDLTKWKLKMPTVSAMISTNRPWQLEHVLNAMSGQREVELEVLVMCHGFTLKTERKRELEEQFGAVKWLEETSDTPLGECYNLLASQASGELVAKIDDDDHYGEHYLFDQLAAMNYSDAEVVGKAAHFLYLENQDATVLRFPETEHKYRPFVSGPTIVAKRSTVLDTQFPATCRGEDTGFLKKVSEMGGKIYSSSRFGFIQVRKSGSGHTWDIDDMNILATSNLLSYGKALNHVIF